MKYAFLKTTVLSKTCSKNHRAYGEDGVRGTTLKNVVRDTLKKDRNIIKVVGWLYIC